MEEGKTEPDYNPNDTNISHDMDKKYGLVIQKYNENLKTTEDLLRRIVALEDRIEKCIDCRVIRKVIIVYYKRIVACNIILFSIDILIK